MRIRSFISKHKALVSGAAVVAIGLVVFVLVWFQPQKLLIEKKVVEAAPTEPASASSGAPPTSPVVVASGSFRSLEHPTKGAARVLRLSDGSHVLRLEGLDTSNGPDVRVYLSKVPPDRGQNDYGRDFVDLGALKGNRGSQNYRIPASVDVRAFRSAVLWCRRFTVGFGVAPLA